MASLSDLVKQGNKTQRGIYQGMSNIPVVGGFSRLLRYPMEFGRQLTGVLPALLAKDKGAAFEELSTPMFMSEDEFSKMTGKSGVVSPVIEGASAGSEVANLIPWAQGLKGGSAISKAPSAVKWLAPKVGEGVITGAANTFAAQGEGTNLGELAKGAGVSSALNIVLGGLGEVGSELSKAGKRTRASSIGVAKPGQSTEEMMDTLKRMNDEYGGVPLTAQGVIDKTAKEIAPLGEKKVAALGKITKSTDELGTQALAKLEDYMAKSARPESLLTSEAYNDTISAIVNASKTGSVTELDDLAIKLRELVPYGSKEPTAVVAKEMYDLAADAIVDTLKDASPQYRVAKEGLSKVLGDRNLRETVRAAASEIKGTTIPLTFNTQTPVPKQLFSLLGSLTGGIEDVVGGLTSKLGSQPVKNLATRGAIEGLSGSGGLGDLLLGSDGTQETQQVPQSQTGMVDRGQGAFVPLSTPDEDDEVSMAIRSAFETGGRQDMAGDMGQVGQMGQGVGRGDEIRQALAIGVLGGEVSATEAKAVLDLLGLSETQKEAAKLPASALSEISSTQEAISLLPELTNLLQEGASAFGPIEGQIRSRLPWDRTGQQAKSTIQLVRQIIGKGLEGGVLRKEDEYKYENILPKLGDTEQTAKDKISMLDDVLTNKYKTLVGTYQSGGYDPFYGQ